MAPASSENDIGAPQAAMNEFWENLVTKKPAKVTKIFPPSLYAHLLPPQSKLGTATGKNAAESYQAAANECRARVKRIVRECHRTNEKFTDADFDIEDLQDKNCLEGLMHWYDDPPAKTAAATVNASRLGSALSTLIQSDVLMQTAAPFDLVTTAKLLNSKRPDDDGPGSAHRLDWIFDTPQFEIDGFSSSDVVQGSNGDCWLIAAVASICSHPELINKVCVERDAECGVYGFVFYRDGEWIWTVVDDNLFLKHKDLDAYGDVYDPSGTKEAKYRRNNQTGSTALYFASCADENETWLPLLEKAYAKVHGDYDAIAGGWSGEAIEDLTGGVTTKILTDRVLSKDRLWNELLQVNQQFLFSASSPGSYGDDSDARRGLALSHAYSILKAVQAEGEDGKKQRLVLIRNPWGKRANAAMGEWTGPWSDGSAEWTPYWMNRLGHKFGNDGLFWMSYEDMLKRFNLLDRTRLFDADWTVVQHWTSVSVAWVTGYLNTKFKVEIKKPGPTVFVLCQLDDRYFRGLVGKYDFDLHFILQEKDAPAGEYIVRARSAWFGNRSISAEVHLEAGTYEVLPKIEASRDADAPDVQDVVTKVAERNPQKLRQIGLNYDIANAKGVLQESEEEKAKIERMKKQAAEKKRKDEEADKKDKEDFEAWKKEEKAEYEAWKKQKIRDEKTRSAQAPINKTQQNAKVKATDPDKKPDATKAEPTVKQPDTNRDHSSFPTGGAKNNHEDTTTTPFTIRQKDTQTTQDTDPTPPTETIPQTNPLSDTPSEPTNETPSSPEHYSLHLYPDSRPLYPSHRYNHDHDHDHDQTHRYQTPIYNPRYQRHIYAEEDRQRRQPRPTTPSPAPAPEKPKPWNAVCVLGLRVYSQDTEVSIELVRPRDVEEGAILDVDGGTKAGATM
ncbi:cysteine proteinase [Plenodomus tracheiphilus IPT5]|uniref:Cysteine proteinase n=1 Tax=Plenodomus tracheiphilus IPT5 TaxID=1408161 RepID=A0A6A7B4Q0_9PLEO|nr:cysteine proteinase [Plenodomus tracheiphilus IPT5]